MDNFNSSTTGYNKQEVNEFVDYVISKTEENIKIINMQKEEIKYLRDELEKSKYSFNNYDEKRIALAEKEASLIIATAKDDASRIVNDALLKSEKMRIQKEAFNNTVHSYKKRLKNALMEQLDELDDIEML